MSILNKIKNIIDTNTNEEILYKKWSTNNRDELFTQIYWNYSPITSKYFFEGNPAFFYEYKDLFDMGRYPITMIRDGFLGILDFFLVHPKPIKDYQSILLLPQKYEALIPTNWKDQVALYSLELNEKFVEKNKDHLVVYGYSTEEMYLKSDIEERVKELKADAEKYKKIDFIFPQRDSLLSSEKVKSTSKFSLDLYKNIYKYFGFETEIHHDIDKFFVKNKLENFTYINFNKDKVLINDDFMDYYLISANAYPLNMNHYNSNEKNLSYNLSLNHKVVIREFDSSKSKFNELYVNHRMKRKTSSIYELFNYSEVKESFQKLY